jgi:hypothetical protein
VSHPKAALTPVGRLILIPRIAQGRPWPHVAGEMACPVRWRTAGGVPTATNARTGHRLRRCANIPSSVPCASPFDSTCRLEGASGAGAPAAWGSRMSAIYIVGRSPYRLRCPKVVLTPASTVG